jgi:NAD(P)-dependent dehydrogenase (short-subunit alcohol dehydrogenase family)
MRAQQHSRSSTTKALHVTGAHIYGTVRNMPKGQKVVERILSEKLEGGGKISLLEISLDSVASVRAGAQAFLQKSDGKLNVMVCNAAIMASPFGQTKDGFEQPLPLPALPSPQRRHAQIRN